ncbi:MAG: methyltransferase domain-containing protein [Paraglaciecola sp.]|uniref:methyltransferase domain-containing protein n=1 Tax=Paraglaciecola sp. TaxID=1920173 RepID=UPI003296E2D9
MLVDSAALQKSRIAKQFSRAANMYNAAADVQLDIAFDAVELVPKKCALSLDIGCGTGRVTKQLATKTRQVIGMDLAFGMVNYAKQQFIDSKLIDWIQGDAENIPLAQGSVDMVFSSMALQWCTDLNTVMSELQRVLRPGGHGVLAIMCEGSFEELNRSWQQVDEYHHVNTFETAKSWHKAASEQGLRTTSKIKSYVTWHNNIRDLLASIKSIGANVVLPNPSIVKVKSSTKKSNYKPLSRNTLQNLETAYRKNYEETLQLPLTYQVCFIQITKPL